jgi:peptidoglycan/LPS O-acetylase OafA/YrhL
MFRNAGPTTSGATAGAERGAAARTIGHLETARGLAIVLVVVYHAIGNDPSHGVHAAVGTWPWWTARLFDLVQLPLFAYVSGRVFALPLGDDRRFARALGRKLVRLAVPLVVVTALFMVAMRLSGLGSGPGWVAAYTRSFEHLWYLQASLILDRKSVV